MLKVLESFYKVFLIKNKKQANLTFFLTQIYFCGNFEHKGGSMWRSFCFILAFLVLPCWAGKDPNLENLGTFGEWTAYAYH